MIPPEFSRRVRQLGWASCRVSSGRVTMAGGTSFSHVNTLARLPRQLTACRGREKRIFEISGFLKGTNLRYKNRLISTKPTLIE